MSAIGSQEVDFFQKRQRDDVGRVFTWRGRILRGVFPGQESRIAALFSSGLPGELMERHYIPRVWFTDHTMDGFPLILEHERVWPVVYPQEWTFSMLRDAAILVCDIGQVARQYGYNMKDCHGLNVLFDGVEPRYSDLGSFVPDVYGGWLPYHEFLRFYYYPLMMWRDNSFIGKLSIFSGHLTPDEEYWLYACPLTRRLPPRVLSGLIRVFMTPTRMARRPISELESGSIRARLAWALMRRRLVHSGSLDLAGVTRRLRHLGRRAPPSTWGDYHERLGEKAERFDRIAEIVSRLEGEIRTAVDLGGNQGRFVKVLLEKTPVQHAVCIDNDEDAVEAGYARARTEGESRVTFAHYDVMGAIVKRSFSLPSERYKADVVTALALTHHLILTDGYDVHDVLETISSYATRYALVEFMPRGLWPSGSGPGVPDWYTRQWFREAFSDTFDLVLEEPLRDANVLFLGRVRRP